MNTHEHRGVFFEIRQIEEDFFIFVEGVRVLNAHLQYACFEFEDNAVTYMKRRIDHEIDSQNYEIEM